MFGYTWQGAGVQKWTRPWCGLNKMGYGAEKGIPLPHYPLFFLTVTARILPLLTFINAGTHVVQRRC